MYQPAGSQENGNSPGLSNAGETVEGTLPRLMSSSSGPPRPGGVTDTGAVPRAETQGYPAGAGAVAEIDGNRRCGGDGPRFLSSLL